MQDEDDLNIRMQRIITSRPTFIEVKVSQKFVGAIIGHGGSNIKDLQEITNTTITFKRECKYFCEHIW
jgi:transcription antitermination factor NusA-like protein